HINGIELPEHRADLYEVVSTMLLNTRDRAKGLKHIEVTQALDLLGPLAYQMQENDNNIARYANVIACFSRIIAAQTGGASDSEWVKRQAEHFLQLVRDRSGLFVIRVADFFGFFHRSFQEYFAARHILQQIQREGESALDEFVARVRRQDDLWREPFLLAVGYVSKSDETLARRILTALLEAAREDELPGRLHAALLAATCVLEAVPFSIDTRLKERIAHELLSGYAEAQRAGAFERCAQVEDILTRWLRTVGAGYQQPVPLSTLDLALRGVAGLEIQRAALTILSLIAQNLGECHERVFETLVPTLRGLTGLNDTGLNGIGPRRATTAIAPATDCLLADLALTALSYLGPKGPAGAYLAEVREHFASNPDQWQLLARYSLECRVLLSFAEVPAEGERFTRFETAIERWIALRDRLAADGTTKAVAIAEPDVTVCREILVELLECAEETCYPEAMHLLAMLRASVKQPDRPWRAVWKDYLVQHLHASSAVTYQVAVLLWTVLFPHQVEQEAIADRVMRDYRGGGSARPFAQHLIALLVNDLTEPTELRNLDELHYLIYLRDLSYRRYLRDMSNMPNVRNLRYLSYLRR
ncbi:MAG TPA: hypothetical protein VID72_08180, partial [Ktedonobacterales bacterium]